MLKHPSITQQRIAKTLDRIRPLIYGPTAPVQIEAHHVGGEPIPFAQAAQQEYRPFTVGDIWGSPWDTTWFRFSATIPAGWEGREVVALVRLGYLGGEGFTAEGLVWQNGVPTCAINVNRADVSLVKNAHPGEVFTWHIEAAANPNMPHEGYRNVHAYLEGKPQFTLQQAEIACFNREAFDFFHDFKVAFETFQALPNHLPPPSWFGATSAHELVSDPRRGQLLYALNTAVNLFNENDPKTIAPARAALAEVLSKHNGDTAHHLSAIGHAHIDTAWLWPLRETIRKCARTFSTALAYMEEYPDYIFGCSQPQQYAWMKQYYPTIFEGIKKAIQRGQWEPIGSMWIEADCNLSSGESLVRQILHGKNFFLEEFGYETTDVWLPDVFGYAASMPQIMQKAGVKYFVTQKISWSQFNKFPHHTFQWEGIDGTRIFTHFPPADTYNADFSPKQLLYNVHNFKENDRATRSLYVYGYGDGGGGPTKGMLEIAARTKDLEGLPKVTLEKVSEFLPKAEADAKDLPLWVGELYLELHRGTYTTQAANKRNNRKCELLLRDAEFFHSVSGALQLKTPALPPSTSPRAVYDVTGLQRDPSAAAFLERAWKLLLLNQFHDIIPGSSIHWVYQDSDRDYATIRELGGAVRDGEMGAVSATIDTSGFAKPLLVFNTTSYARAEVVTLADGSPIFVEVPACGYAVVEQTPSLPPAMKPVEVTADQNGIVVDNGILCVVFDAEGHLSSVRDLCANREIIAPGERGNVFQLHRDLPNNWDAWDVDIHYRETCEPIGGLRKMEVVEQTPLRVTVRIERAFGKSSIAQNVRLCAGSPRLDFETKVDWQEDHQFLKVAFPVAIRSDRATYEIQYGHAERPTHYNTSWDMARFEVCAQKWADLSEADYGVALLNDCKYGHDIFGHVLRLSLLRASTAPDPVADRGHHQFVYSLLPHAGDFRAGEVVQHAYALNIPLHITPVEVRSGTLPNVQSFFTVDRPGVVIEAIKRAEKENALIVRFYEAHGARGPVKLRTSLPLKKAFTADLLERTLQPVEFANGEIEWNVTPFEIVTLKFPLL